MLQNVCILLILICTHTDALFGLGENNLQVVLPLMIRPSPPRFLKYACHVLSLADFARIGLITRDQLR